ncbi:hypothetical protein KM043_010284 [Ampulex compressa]|nr:hypothetical protein KM043_010284 [Ampulex compressa]
MSHGGEEEECLLGDLGGRPSIPRNLLLFSRLVTRPPARNRSTSGTLKEYPHHSDPQFPQATSGATLGIIRVRVIPTSKPIQLRMSAKSIIDALQDLESYIENTSNDL